MRARLVHAVAATSLAMSLVIFGGDAGMAWAGPAPGSFAMYGEPQSIPEIGFEDGAGQWRRLTGFRGKVVLLNLWATWCVPCRKEMPTLDRLQAELGGPDFEVVALSIDRTGIEAVRKFYAEVGVQHLAMYLDRSGKAARELSALGLPTTLLIDRNGREVGRLVGPAERDTPEMIAFLRSHLAKPTGAMIPADRGQAAVQDGRPATLASASPMVASHATAKKTGS